MSLLTPLGLLGLIGIIALIIIYIIKPNYQNKFIPSTYIWKLSLKYRKKRIPLSKLRNILLFICQILIITAATFILAQPFIDNALHPENGDTVLIIDTSASMHTQVNYKTRLSRAVTKARTDAEEALSHGNKITIIIADEESHFLVKQAGEDQLELINDAFDVLEKAPETLYTYGSPDIEGAMSLSEQITELTDNVTVTLYTDTTYINSGEVKVHNVSEDKDWNAAILDVRTSIVENYYRIEIDVACYGADQMIEVACEIFNANDLGKPMEIYADAYCSGDEVTTLVFGYPTEDMSEEERDLFTEEVALFSYDHIYAHISVYDSLDYDNQFYLYDGKKPTINVYYYSSLPNNYFTSALLVLQDAMRDSFDIQITEAVPGEMVVEGYDIYFYEHTMPQTLPTDGLVFCVNPSKLPNSAGIKLGGKAGSQNGEEIFLTAGESHPIMKNIDATKISVTEFTVINSYDEYVPLVTFSEDYPLPLLLVKDEIDAKVVIMPFSLHYSNLAVLPEFPLLLKNSINHFFPETVKEYVFETNQTVDLNARGDKLEVGGPSPELGAMLEELPGQYKVTKHGTYTLTQTTLSGDPMVENIYVRIPATESNIFLEESVLVNPYFYSDADANNIDLLFYFALAAVALLFIEWWLKSREQI